MAVPQAAAAAAEEEEEEAEKQLRNPCRVSNEQWRVANSMSN